MKKILSLLALAAVLFACTPEQINHPTEDMVPSAASYEPVISVDQTTNQVSFSLPQGTKGVIPVWEFPDKNGEYTQYSAKNGLTRIYTTSGDYPVRMQIMNAAGLSPDYVERSFHIDNTIVNFDKYYTFFAGNSSKEWRLKGEVDGHFGCGEPGTTGTGWWAAKAWEKESTGIYDDRMTFTTDGAYTYNPGPDGMTYVNKDVTKAPGHSGETEDYNAEFPETATGFTFSVEGDDLYVTLAEAAFAYFPNDDFISAPKFKVESANTKTIELVNDNGSIAWHFTLSSEEPDNSGKPFEGFKYNAESNLWLPADAAHTYSQYYAPGWSQLDNPDIDYEDGTYSFTSPSATFEQWQNQFFIIPVNDIALSSAVNYDFSVKMTLSQDVKGVTFKLTDASDDGNFLFTERRDLKAFEDYIFYLVDLPGIDASAVKMVFDFGGNPDNTEVTISHIVLKDHAVDDGTVLPDDKPDEPDDPSQYTYGPNLWDGSAELETWFSPGDWSGGLDAGAVYEGGVLTLTTPEGIGGSEWQGQVKLHSSIAIDPEKQYSFSCKVFSGASGTITIKGTSNDDPGGREFFYDNGVALAAYEDMEYIKEPVSMAIEEADANPTVMIVFDFGRIPAGTEIKVTDIVFREITGENGGGSSHGDNLWDGSAELETWFSPGDWSGGLDAGAVYEGGVLTLTTPEGIGGSEWQGQVKLHSGIAIDPAKEYAFSCKVNSSVAGTITIKGTSNDDPGGREFFYDNGVALAAYEDLEYVKEPISMAIEEADANPTVMIVFDFGRIPAGAEITVSDIVFCELGSGDGGSADGTQVWDWTGGTLETWFSPGDWSGGLDPQASFDGSTLTLTTPEGIGGSEWQGQVKLHTAIVADPAATYDFACIINSEAAGACTVKMTDNSDPGGREFFYDNGVSLTAYEDFAFSKTGVSMDVTGDEKQDIMIVFDFGRIPAGTPISVSGISLIKH